MIQPATLTQTMAAPMRDGVLLASDIYLPADRPQPLPALLLRTPYDRRTAARGNLGRFFAEHGYGCVIQDVRGRYDSGGQWRPFLDDPADGYDTIQWLGQQPWCDGQVGTFGSSYSGSIQSATATLNPPNLRCMVIAAGAANCWQATMRHHGALELRWIVYILGMAASSREARGDPAVAAELHEALEKAGDWLVALPADLSKTALRHVPGCLRWLQDLLEHQDCDDYWRQRAFAYDQYLDEHADVATLYFGGWYDTYAGATCGNFQNHVRLRRAPQALIMGPWRHEGWAEPRAGELCFGSHAAVDFPALCLRWFDRHLKPGRADVDGPVRLFVMGGGSGRRLPDGAIEHGGQWRDASTYPLPNTQWTPHYLHLGGRLLQQAPTGDAAPSQFTFDADRPVPTVGGCLSGAGDLMLPGGFDQRPKPGWWHCQDQTPLAQRPDVLVFQTDPLPQPVEIAGPLRVLLYVASSAADTDFVAKLIDVYPASAEHPQGLAINLTDGILRCRYRSGGRSPQPLQPGVPQLVALELFPTANHFAAGHRIRVDISSSNFPRFDVLGGSPCAVGGSHPVRQTIFHDAMRPSHIVLPTIPPP